MKPPSLTTAAFVSHVEWPCRDLTCAQEFFQRLFGWEFKAFGNNYLLCDNTAGPAIGLLRQEEVTPARPCTVFVKVDSINESVQTAIGLGGTLAVVKTAIPGYGWYAQLTDLDGNLVGLFEAL